MRCRRRLIIDVVVVVVFVVVVIADYVSFIDIFLVIAKFLSMLMLLSIEN